jgi:hexosaminidase
MAAYRMNVLHLHLTDDQGWRLEIKKHPELTRKGAFFDKRYAEPAANEGFYTQEEMKSLIDYARRRHVEIVPEIEMPSHCNAVLVCRPELACPIPFMDGIMPHKIMIGIARKDMMRYPVFCAGNDATFEFLEEVLDEVCGLFRSSYVHVGGDETPKMRWEKCPKCQARIQSEGLSNEKELQSYFIKRIEKFLNAKGKRLLGWDEILEGGLAPRATVMSWRGMQGGIAAATAGHDVVMTPTTHCYFDYTYKAINSELAYAFEPVPKDLSPAQARHILGLQASFWSHIDRTPDRVDQDLFPRLLSLAERAWSPQEVRNWPDFRQRLQSQLPRLTAWGIHCYPDDVLSAPIK